MVNKGIPEPPAITAISVAESNKLGHAGAVCWQNQSKELIMKPQQKCNAKQLSKPMHTVASAVLNSDDEEFDNSQLSVHKKSSRYSSKLTTVLDVDGVALEMEVDTGAELSTIPVAIYQQKLRHIKLYPSAVRLHQYDGSTIPIKGEIRVTVSTKEQSVTGNFVIAGIKNDQLPLTGQRLAAAVATGLAQVVAMSLTPPSARRVTSARVSFSF